MVVELIRAIDQVRDKIKKHAGPLSKNEALTRYALIDPILRALGWDTEDPDLVVPEFSISTATGTSTPDYVLFWNSSQYIAVEAKALYGKLAAASAKSFSYAWSNGIPFYLITDGETWELHDMGAVGGRKIFDLKITGSINSIIIRDLIILHRQLMPIHIASASAVPAGGGTATLPSPSSVPTPPFVPPPSSGGPTPGPASPPSSTPPPGKPGARYSIKHLISSGSPVSRTRPPSELECHCTAGSTPMTIMLKTWADVLVEVIKCLDQVGKLPKPPYYFGRSRAPLYDDAKSAQKMRNPKVIPTTSWGSIQIETGWPAGYIVNIINTLIAATGCSASDFILIWK